MNIVITKVKYQKPATIVFWSDGTKTVSRCGEKEKFDKEKGLAIAILKKYMGSGTNVNMVLEAFAGDPKKTEETIENPFISELDKVAEEISVALKKREELIKDIERTSQYLPNRSVVLCQCNPNVGKGRCNHVCHETENEKDFIDRMDPSDNNKS